jgi:hypothetical protein
MILSEFLLNFIEICSLNFNLGGGRGWKVEFDFYLPITYKSTFLSSLGTIFCHYIFGCGYFWCECSCTSWYYWHCWLKLNTMLWNNGNCNCNFYSKVGFLSMHHIVALWWIQHNRLTSCRWSLMIYWSCRVIVLCRGRDGITLVKEPSSLCGLGSVSHPAWNATWAVYT